MTVEVKQAVEVPVGPEEAFRIFTEEYDDWWVRAPTTFFDGGRAREMRIEPGVGGRILEVYDDAAGDALERGRITVWEPGHRLAFVAWDGTEAEFAFQATRTGTRVSVEHRPLPGHDRTEGVAGTLRAMLSFFARRAGDPNHVSWAQRDLPRVIPVLRYQDPIAAARWLIDTFSFVGDVPEPGSLPRDFPIPLRLGDGAVIVVGTDDAASDRSASAGVYTYVDDLDAHYERSVRRGAPIIRDIQTYGDCTYLAEDVGGHQWTFAQSRPTQRNRSTW